MPKINVYLPDDLAAAVKRAGFPVSPVCQRALAEAVKNVTAIRRSVAVIRDHSADAAALEALESGSDGRTARLTSIIDHVVAGTAESALASTGALLLGLLDEGSSLAVGLIGSLDVDLDDLRAAVESACEAIAEPGDVEAGAGQTSWLARLTWPARDAIAAATECALDLGHNYVGTEHVLLGLLADPASEAGHALLEQGMDAAATRRALTSALAGYAQGRQASAPPLAARMDDIVQRLEAVERRLASAGV
ncbi:MAG TPA: Clp protease N-terminal domain-containing protein [Streptosporangiaceae bacterium]|jgi:ATP-dependent Clp protease ATP-binding subunit ClpA|nr:Clp protease N-terminal domain-containing protein [Streptosporangiaceae bacterium]